MPVYNINGKATNTAATTLGYISAHATVPRRTRTLEIVLGSGADGANAAIYHLKRITAENGTPGGTALTPAPLDPEDAAATNKPRNDPNEPTYGSEIVMSLPKNQRATTRFVALEDRRTPVTPKVADDGLGLLVDAVSTAYEEAWSWQFEE